MQSLRDLQQQFAAAVLDDAPAVITYLRDGAFPAERHLQVYRNNTFANLTEALGAIYPVVHRLVGDEFFGFITNRFIPLHPPRSGNLHDFGGELAEFLARFEPAQSLPYLPDVARLEWAWHESFHAGDAMAFDLSSLSGVAPERYGSLVFALQPSARLVASPYPILRIWEVNQPDFAGDQTVNLDQGTDRLLVVRRGLRVEIEAIPAGDYALLAAFQESKPLGVAHDAAVAAEPTFDLMQTLQRHLQSETIAACRLE